MRRVTIPRLSLIFIPLVIMLESMASTSTKLTNKFKRSRGPPPVPEKDIYLAKPPAPYASSAYSQSTASISTSISQNLTPSSSRTNQTPSPQIQDPPTSSSRSMKSFRRAIAKLPTKLPPMPKRPNFASMTTSSTVMQEQPTPDYGDDNISLPWNISVSHRLQFYGS